MTHNRIIIINFSYNRFQVHQKQASCSPLPTTHHVRDAVFEFWNRFDNYDLKYLDESSKKAIAAAFGSPYGVELLPGINSSMRRCHRYLTQILWPKTRYDNSGNRRQIIHSTDLYAESGIPSLPEIHQKRRNDMITKARTSENILIREILGPLKISTELLLSNARCKFKFGKISWA